MKKLVVFDLDGTLAESKSAIDPEMAALLDSLLDIVKVAVISGGDWPQFEQQLLANLPSKARLTNLSILPTTGTKYYKYASGAARNPQRNRRGDVIRSGGTPRGSCAAGRCRRQSNRPAR